MKTTLGSIIAAILTVAAFVLYGEPSTGNSDAPRALPMLPGLALSDRLAHTPSKKIKLMWPSTMPTVPSTVKVYRTMKPRLRQDWEQRVSYTLKKKGNSANVLAVSCTGTAAGWCVKMYPSGSISLRRVAQGVDRVGLRRVARGVDRVQNDGEKKQYPDAAEADRIARKFLISRGLWEKNAVLRRVVDNTSGADVMSVGYDCVIDGIKVFGPGSRIIVDVGEKGEIQNVYKSWPIVKEVGQYPIISPKEALAKFKKGEGYLPLDYLRGRVTSFDLVYRAPPHMDCEYLLPAYRLTIVVPGREEKDWGFLPAVESRFLEKHRSRKPATQPASGN